MALAAVKTWNPGDTLTAADLNALNTNILNNPISLVSPTTGAINFNLQGHTNLLPSVVTASSGSAGSVLVASTAATPATMWTGGASAGSLFVASTATLPTWLAVGGVGGLLTVSSSTTVPAWISIGTSGQVLTVTSSTVVPSFQAASVSGVVILDRVTTDVSVSNTAVETAIYTKSIPGGTLSTNGQLRLTLVGIWSNVLNDLTTLTLRMKYGATTLSTIIPVPGDGTNVAVTNKGFKVEAYLHADGATNAQQGVLMSFLDIDGAKTNATKIFQFEAGRGTSAIDSTVANNFVVTVQWSAAVAGDNIVMEHAVLEQR